MQIAQQYIDAAQAAQKAYGVPSSVTLAQFILESGWGKHDLGCNNFFGIKYGSNVKCDGFVERQTREVINGKSIMVNAKFAKFNTVEGAFLEHARFIAEHAQLSRAMAFKDDPDKFAAALVDGKIKYATEPKYAELLIKIMKGSNLYQYDLKGE